MLGLIVIVSSNENSHDGVDEDENDRPGYTLDTVSSTMEGVLCNICTSREIMISIPSYSSDLKTSSR